MDPNIDAKFQQLKEFMDSYRSRRYSESNLITILHKAQELFGHLDRKVMDAVAHYMNIPTAHIWGVATFYHYFTLSPRGRHLVSVCLGTACYIKGADEVLEAIKKELAVEMGGTSPDGLFTLAEARCLGACGLAPVIMVDDKIYGSLTPAGVIQVLKTYKKAAVAAAKKEAAAK